MVVRAPQISKKTGENLVSIVNIGLLTYADEEFGVRESFEEKLRTEYGNSMKEFLRERKKIATQQKLEILLTGRVEIPQLVCQKELAMPEIYQGARVIPLVLKKGVSGA